MPLDDPNVVDAIGVDRSDGSLVLSVADNADWTDVDAHVELLRAKVDAYREFVDSGELALKYPKHAALPLVIEIVFSVAPPSAGVSELERIAAELSATGRSLRWRTVGS